MCGSTPRPVEALPWGSLSIRSTLSPIAVRAVARLIAVVVLPTPPFWLAMARMRQGFGSADTCESLDPQEASVRVAEARQGGEPKAPGLPGFGDFGVGAAALEEQADRAAAERGRGEAQ